MKKLFLLLGLALMFSCTSTTEVVVEDSIDSCKAAADTTEVVALDTIVKIDTIKVVK